MRENIFDLKVFQSQQLEWSNRNFGGRYGSGYRSLLGLIEEIGELEEVSGFKGEEWLKKIRVAVGLLCHAHLKDEQNIRINEDHHAAKIDAIGDIVIYLVGYCNDNDIDLENAVKNTWKDVLKRDWNKNRKNGV